MRTGPLRDVEVSVRRVRWVALGFVIVQFGMYTPPAGVELPFPRWPVAALVFLVLLAVNLVSLRLTPRLSGRDLGRLGAAETIIDTGLVIVITVLFGFDDTTRIWPLLTFPIVEGAMRGGLRGALLTWGLGAGGFVVDQLVRLPNREDPAAWVGSMPFGAGILLFVALGTGYLATRLEEASARAVLRSQRLRRLADLAREVSQQRSPTAVFATAVTASTELTGFDAGCFFEAVGDGRWRRYGPDDATLEAPEAEQLDAITRLVETTDAPLQVPPGSDLGVWPRAGQVGAVLAVPVRQAEEALGVLVLVSANQQEVDPELLDVLRVLAADVAVALRNARLAEAELRQIHQLEQLDAAKDEFVAILTHELRAPMTAIVGYADMLVRKWDSLEADRRRDYLGNIEDGVHRLSDLVGDILDATQAQHTELSIRVESCDLTAIVRRIAEREVGASPRHELRFDGRDDVVALADPERVQQIAQNLINNAIKYSPEGGPVSVSVSRFDDDEVVFRVTDEGLGMPAAAMPLLFGKFNRFHPSTGIKGTGLGLYLVRTLVEAMAGRVDVDTGEGIGTTFSVYLPTASRPDVPARTSSGRRGS